MSAIDQSASIHSTAVIAETAVIGANTKVGPYTVIGDRVKIGADNTIASHVVIEGNTTIGDKNHIFQFASVGAQPQDLKFHGEDSTLEIGDSNIIREYATLQPGTDGGGMCTIIGNGNLFMACSHVGHDGKIGNNNIFANAATLAGHVIVEDCVLVGGLVAVHQFVRIGENAMLGGGAMVTKDVPPFLVAQGDRAGLVGVHKIGMERRGFSAEEITAVRSLYKNIFLSTEGTFESRLSSLEEEVTEGSAPEKVLKFIRNSERGVAFPRK